LVALGPLTNLALATRLDPTLPKKYERLVVMEGKGGAK
jgi:purine nucleosidase